LGLVKAWPKCGGPQVARWTPSPIAILTCEAMQLELQMKNYHNSINYQEMQTGCQKKKIKEPFITSVSIT
jgi:hypothetical protein